ncbi:conjugative transfer signal peptidase TraF [Gilliamella sp. B2894]|uniref:conjugative transfer signal peptidase TraF n=1 Tax=Gilliamella sp. B2894 TaxID=2817978 RepID=UPI00226AE107|nr:conjugative transfer signal peptidase TraF [Gilliamella sp. B2894]MCX8657351.1 conjugative transfer signal peptidase TraF [Gilliamella sp. B2894]
MKTFLFSIFLLLVTITAINFSGYRINTTKSIPIGLYKEVNSYPQINDYVIFCPPDNSIFQEAKIRNYIGIGLCSGNYGYLMKKIVAVTGDYVTISEKGVFINNKYLPLSTPLKTDSKGRELPVININKVLNDSDVLLMSDISNTSFDARYYGTIDKKHIRSVIKPIFILGEKNSD